MIDKIDEALEALGAIDNPDHFIRKAIKDLNSQKHLEQQKEFVNQVKAVRDIVTDNDSVGEEVTKLDVDIYFKLKAYFDRERSGDGVFAETLHTRLEAESAGPIGRSTRWRDRDGCIWYWESVAESRTATPGWTTDDLRNGAHWDSLSRINEVNYPLTRIK